MRQFDRVLLADAADAIRTATQNFQAGQIDGLELLETLRTLRSIELEHLRALHRVPDRGSRFFAVPVKVKSFCTFPVRAFAIV